MIGRPVDGEDLVADLEPRAVGRRSLQHRIDEVAAVDLDREVADAGIRYARPPEPLVELLLGHAGAAEHVKQDVVLHIVGRQQGGVRGLELGEQRIDAASRLIEARCLDHARAHLGRALLPADLREPLLVPERCCRPLHHRVEQLAEVGGCQRALRRGPDARRLLRRERRCRREKEGRNETCGDASGEAGIPAPWRMR